MAHLLFFTQMYPYGRGETFIEDEIAYLAEAYDRITILPWIGTGAPTREVPENCTVLPPMLKNDRDTILSGIFSLAPLWYFIRKYFSDRAYTSFSKTIKYVSVATFCRAILSNRRFKQVNTRNGYDTLYFYWGIGTAYVLPFIKSPGPRIVRFHGADIYLERRKDAYLPFRKEVYTRLTKAVFISNEGLEYATQRYARWGFKGYVSYLGTPDYGLPVYAERDARIQLLSCSNVIPVKRVELILRALKQITDLEIVWTHIGDGSSFDALLREASAPLPDNLEVRLAGYKSHAEVIEFYRTQPVDIFINVSSSEGLPVAIMEAISFNIPVIATHVGGVAEIVTEEVGVLLDKDFRTADLIRAVETIIKTKNNYSPRNLWKEKFYSGRNYPDFVHRILIPEVE